ncbi:MAG: cation-transporting P-type ATPase [Nitrososphaerota archaeon]|nr:cation-transporting P-type ATPase [Nitrososphaerota archaeon]
MTQKQATVESKKVLLSDLVENTCPNFKTGLTDSQVRERIEKYGRNTLFPKRRGSRWGVLAFLKEPMVWLLIVAGVVYLLLGETLDATVVLVAIIPIGLIDVVIEVKKERALEQLEKLGEPAVVVVRNGRRTTIPSEDLVPGDRLIVDEGKFVMADCAIVESSDLSVDESSLTGESVPVEKGASEFYSEEFFGNTGSVFAGSKILRGRATCMVVNTGQSTHYGKIGSSLAATAPVHTKLQNDIDRIVKIFGIVAVGLSLLLILLELTLGQSLSQAILGGVSLAIAAIPEELPVVFTLFLSLGMFELAKNKALIKKLPAVEALGSVNIICTDKTGTLTTGRMEIVEVFIDKRYPLSEFAKKDNSSKLWLYAMMACEVQPFDYMEKAIYDAGKSVAFEELKSWKLVNEYPFDPKEKYMSHVWRSKSGQLVISAKGAVEAILARSKIPEERKSEVLQMNEKMGDDGIRVLGVASKQLFSDDSRAESEKEMTFVGLIGFHDPIREETPSSIQEAQRAGVRVVMLTGDHKATAHAIAHAVGLEHDKVISGDELEAMSDAELEDAVKNANVFCRVLPQQKLRIVEVLQRIGYSVAVTGDGINDAPALKRANIGIAMGEKGTDVAKEAASLVLLDDNFATMVGAIKNGRKIYDNIQNAFKYLVAFHIPIFLSALIVPILRFPLLLVPVDIVVLELVLHPVVSIVFERQRADPEIMSRSPRTTKTPFLGKAQFARLAGIGFLIFLLSAGLYAWAISNGMEEAAARGLGLSMMILGQLAIIPTELSSRGTRLSEITTNKYTVAMISLVIVAYVVTMYTPFLAFALQIYPISSAGWILVIVLSLLILATAELSKRKIKSST